MMELRQKGFFPVQLCHGLRYGTWTCAVYPTPPRTLPIMDTSNLRILEFLMHYSSRKSTGKWYISVAQRTPHISTFCIKTDHRNHWDKCECQQWDKMVNPVCISCTQDARLMPLVRGRDVAKHH